MQRAREIEHRAIESAIAAGHAAPVATYEVGDEVSDLVLPTLDGGVGRLADYRGKVVLLVFTATWCPTAARRPRSWSRRSGSGTGSVACRSS